MTPAKLQTYVFCRVYPFRISTEIISGVIPTVFGLVKNFNSYGSRYILNEQTFIVFETSVKFGLSLIKRYSGIVYKYISLEFTIPFGSIA